MGRWPIVLIASLALSVLMCLTLAVHGANAFGFGVGIPPTFPIVWDASFTFAAVEILAESNLSFLLILGTYPADFPELYEGSASLLIKAWIGPIALYAGGGFSLQWHLIGNAWSRSPFVQVMSGTQLWILDSVAVFARLRSLDSLPATWSFNPEIALGMTIAFSGVRSPSPRIDGDYVWVLISLWVLAFLAYYPRS